MINGTMGGGTCSDGCSKNFQRVFWWTVLIGQSISAIWAAPLESARPMNSTAFDRPESTESRSSACEGEYWVDNKAQTISIPKSNNSDPVVCRWLLKARDKRNTIALYTTDVFIHFQRPFALEARGLPGEDSPLFGSLRTFNGSLLHPMTWQWVKPIKAEGGFLLLTFRNEGYDPFLANFVFYTCGGRYDSVARIATPDFDGITPSLWPTIITCEWQLEKPKSYFYGHLTPVEVNITDCSVLQLYSNSTIRVLEHVGLKRAKRGDEHITENRDSAKDVSRIFDPGVYANYSCGHPDCNINVEPICGNSVRMIAFDSETAMLRYVSSPTMVFRGVYDTFRMPQHSGLVPKRLPWYLDYAALTIFTPIGMLVGLTIMWCQTRSRRPSRLTVVIENDVENSDSFRFESDKRVSQCSVKPPTLRAMSPNSTNNNVSLDESTIQGQKKQITLLQNDLKSNNEVNSVVHVADASPCCGKGQGERKPSTSIQVSAIMRKDSRRSPGKNKKTRSVRFSAASVTFDGLQTL